MSYTNETTHYGIPLPLGTDLTTPMDYNQSAQAIDTALFGAVTDASAGVEKANAVEEALGTTNDNVSALAGRVTTAEGTIVTQGNAITQLQLDVADTKADALDMICAVDEGTAQVASVAVQEGKYFRYNDVLYIATDDIAIGDTFVPNTNCKATNVATELETIESEIILGTSLDSNTNIDLDGYTSSNPYTTPEAGLARIQCASGGNVTIFMQFSNNDFGTIEKLVTEGSMACYVPKGARIYAENNGASGTGNARFLGFI